VGRERDRRRRVGERRVRDIDWYLEPEAGGAIAKMALVMMRLEQGTTGFPLLRGEGRLSVGVRRSQRPWWEVTIIKFPPIELECFTTKLAAGLSVMTCEINCIHIEVGYLMLRRVVLRCSLRPHDQLN
jgi:hypothetical protein